jgi:hypothetical protein
MILSLSQLVNLSTVADAASRCAPVARLVDGNVVYGTARSIGDTHGNFLGSDEDVREGYLRVTTTSGWEVFWPVAELAEEVACGLFGVDVRP